MNAPRAKTAFPGILGGKRHAEVAARKSEAAERFQGKGIGSDGVDFLLQKEG
ncbi:hypothetical protein [Lunatimonas salinarum]|uniref:hypothetical protein n=1 Tax=Lunatimonas salinarum TaxID=1774590 RepID=UPI001AE03797|nr:hypothetical protein [Lunatimonas salinarum]